MASQVPKKAYHHGNLRAALVQAGTTLLRKRGAAGLSLREVAKAAGVSHAAPYRHFEDKQQLLAAIAGEGFRRLRAGLDQAAALHPDDARAQLYAAAEAYIDLATSAPDTMQLMFGGVVDHKQIQGELGQGARTAFEGLVEIIARNQQAGVVVDGDTIELAVSAWSIVHGVGMLVAGGQLGPLYRAEDERSEAVRRVVDRALRGLLVR
jgi:AcrR family transcriptional regulator